MSLALISTLHAALGMALTFESCRLTLPLPLVLHPDPAVWPWVSGIALTFDS